MFPDRIRDLKWAVLGALAILLLASYPQLVMWVECGDDWNGVYAEVNGDEWLYSAYVQALIDGRPRRNDPYTGRDDRDGEPQPESVFSIQFVPAYAIAIPSRLLGLSASMAFLILGIIAPILAYFAIFWLATDLLRSYKLAAGASVVILCMGGLAAGQGIVHLFSSSHYYAFMPFLRRYEPSLPFPLFFVFCVFVSRSLNTSNGRRIKWAMAAGFVLGVLIFSYFYLWTSALAWLACLAILWMLAYPEELWKVAASFAIILLFATAALIPYGILLSRRSHTMEAGHKLISSHLPDLFRVPEFIGIAVIFLIIYGIVQGRILWRSREVLFATSFSLMPFVVFNQQVVTGLSLQPYHYESLIANYVALMGAVLAVVAVSRHSNWGKGLFQPKLVTWATLIAVWWAALEVILPTNVMTRNNKFANQVAAVGQRLREISLSNETTTTHSQMNPRPMVFATENKVPIILPTFAPQAVLWTPHFDFLHLQPGESKERFYTYLYYAGVDGEEFRRQLNKRIKPFTAAAFGHERVIPDLSAVVKPITSKEITEQVADYEYFVSSFSRQNAEKYTLSYVIAPVYEVKLSNLDLWYRRDKGEQIGEYILYYVHLRQ